MRRGRRVAQCPEPADGGQLGGRVRLDPDPVAHHAQAAVLEGARAADHLPLPLPLQVHHAKVDHRAKVGHALQHLEKGLRLRLRTAAAARELQLHRHRAAAFTTAPAPAAPASASREQPYELRVAKAAAHEDEARVQIAQSGRRGRHAQRHQLQARHGDASAAA